MNYKLFARKKTALELWNENKEEFLKIYASQQSKPLDKKQLEKCFVDRNGKIYYRFPESVALPVERLGKLNQFIGWISAGLTASELNYFLDEIDKALNDGLANKDKKASARIGSLVTQIRERQNMVIHTELLYNFLAVQWVREDEAPDVYNNEIQMQKVEQFKKEVANSNSYFFFQQKELKRLNVLLSFTEDEWKQYWQESLDKQRALKSALEVYSKDYATKS